MERRLRTNPRIQHLLVKALNESMSTDLMERLAQRVVSDYDIHERTGFQPSIPIPSLEVAGQIARDFAAVPLLLRLVETLIDVDGAGFMGSRVKIRQLEPLIKEVEALGYAYDEGSRLFMETSTAARTRAWSFLQEGEIRDLSFLKIDVVASSKLVRSHAKSKIARAYQDLQRIVVGTVYRRNGRVWNWEGDGGVLAFLFGEKNVQAALAGMEIIHELFLYNTFRCTLAWPLSVRVAVHTGPCPYHESFDRIQSDTLRRLALIESRFTRPDTVTLSPGVYSDLGPKLSRFFEPFPGDAGSQLYRYALRWDDGSCGS
jgi:class 3 adenylate cyclase